MAPDYLVRIAGIAGAFPAARIANFGFECHLTEGGGRADFAFKLPDVRILDRCMECAEARLEPLAEAWRDGLAIIDVCFEYDVPAAGVDPGPPSLFFMGTASAAMARTIGLVKGPEFLDRIRPGLERALSALPPGASLPMWGLMLSRDLPAVRLCASRMAPAAMRPYLEAQGWRGHAAALDEVLGWVDASVLRTVLDWDVGAEVYPKVALEFYYKEPAPPARPYPWEPLLRTLAERGLCPEATAEALRAFPGMTGPVKDLPENVQAAASLLGNRDVVFVRKPSHFKVSVDAEGQLQAKVYLEFQLYWRSR